MMKIKIDENKFVSMYYANTQKELAKILGFSIPTIARYARYLGLIRTKQVLRGGLPHANECQCPACTAFTMQPLNGTKPIVRKKYEISYSGPSFKGGD